MVLDDALRINTTSVLKYFSIAVIWSIFIAVVSFVPNSSLPEINLNFFEPDKLAHAGVYFLLNGSLIWGFWQNKRLKAKTIWLSFGLSCFYGILMECAQYAFFPYRYFEVYDIIANIIGSLLGLIVAFFLIK